jgi:hypothetical protein
MLQPFFRSSKLRIYRTHDSRYVSPCKQYFTNEELNQTAPTPTITTEGAKIIAYNFFSAFNGLPNDDISKVMETEINRSVRYK